jgi:hypothetical protein
MNAFLVYHPDYNGCVYLHAETRSKARYQVWKKAVEVYDSWKIYSLHVNHEKRLDDKPINYETLGGFADEDDRYQKFCRCDICKKDREEN